jgi:hypothetical protein
VTAIRAWQRSYNAHYPSAMQLSMGCGFGVPVDQQTMAAAVDASWLWGLGQSAKMVADGLGMPLDDFRILNKEYAPSPEDLELHPSGLKIPKGTPAGVRTAFAAYSGGRAFLQIVNEQTAHLGLGPGWRQTADEPNWRVEVDGSPNLRCDIAATAGNDGVDHAAALNAARSLNFVPRVVEARPGCLSVLDLPAPRTTGFRNA